MNDKATLQRVENGVAYYMQEIAIPLEDGFAKQVKPGWSPPKEIAVVEVRVEAAHKAGYKEGWAACCDAMSQQTGAELRDSR